MDHTLISILDVNSEVDDHIECLSFADKEYLHVKQANQIRKISIDPKTAMHVMYHSIKVNFNCLNIASPDRQLGKPLN